MNGVEDNQNVKPREWIPGVRERMDKGMRARGYKYKVYFTDYDPLYCKNIVDVCDLLHYLETQGCVAITQHF